MDTTHPKDAPPSPRPRPCAAARVCRCPEGTPPGGYDVECIRHRIIATGAMRAVDRVMFVVARRKIGRRTAAPVDTGRMAYRR